MIFAVKNHVEQVINGEKTQTRRNSDKYNVGQTYAIQSGRGKKADPRGRILIIEKWEEKAYKYFGRLMLVETQISKEDALAEGGYEPEDYEMLYESISPRWKTRWCYEFEFWSTESIESLKQSLKDAKKHPSVKFDSLRSTKTEEEK